MEQIKTLWEVLSAIESDFLALGYPGMPDLTFQELKKLIVDTVDFLNEIGFGRNDRVAVVATNNRKKAVILLAIMCGATCVPLNPSYHEKEFENELFYSKATVLIMDKEDGPLVKAAAEKLNIPIVEIKWELSNKSPQFFLETAFPGKVRHCQKGWAQIEDIALILKTSGTTGRPKIVPLTQRNISYSAMMIRETLELAFNDRCLNVMPLFHVHGLIVGLLAPLYARSYVSCINFNPLQFLKRMDEIKPTWYSMVPTMHQMVLIQIERCKKIIHQPSLRFIRSASSPMHQTLFHNLEKTFHVPVIEAYGMTEAAHQISSNLLSPKKRKYGTVGIAIGTEIAIVNAAGFMSKPFEEGEITIRGSNVTNGYENDPIANADLFKHGWFRTGDLGFKDEEGFLTITGRIKEMINRGGEKISPYEIDNILLEHPAIADAATFSIPHEILGEEVAALVVLYPNKKVTEDEIRFFVEKRVVKFKAPKKIFFAKEIPKDSKGKALRFSLSAKFGLI